MSEKKPSLGRVRAWLITTFFGVICLKIVLWAIQPYIPEIIGGVILVTICGIALYRTNRF